MIIADEKEFLIVDKPAGILAQPDKSGAEDICTIIRRLFPEKISARDFLAPAHRLDRNTSGAIILVKNSNAATKISTAIQSKELLRTYIAIVKGNPGANGRFDFPLTKNEKSNEVRVDPNGVSAITLFTTLEKLGSASLVEVSLLTGRSHQIRVHFAHAGHALLGDKKYAKKPWSEIFSRPALHSHQITMPPYLGGTSYKAPLPQDIQSLIARLGGKFAL